MNWKNDGDEFLKAINKFNIPLPCLSDISRVDLLTLADFDKISEEGGVYFIGTTEIINHRQHKHKLPPIFNGIEIIYNGIAKDGIRNRILCHLLSEMGSTWSGIGVDIYDKLLDNNISLKKQTTTSHRKKLFSFEEGKTKGVYIEKNNKIIRASEQSDFDTLNFSKEEKELINKHLLERKNVCFRNGINIFDEKHKNYVYTVFFIADIPHPYAQYIESKWRKINGKPRLCSYIDGR